jgi:hypothetical protein
VSIKASLETLARTMSIAFLCLAVVAVGKDQVVPASATGVTEIKPMTTTEQKKININKSKTANSSTPRETKVKLASRTRAPKHVEARGIWLKSLLEEAGFKGKNLKEAWAIVMKESTGRPTAYNGNTSTGDNSYGIFQINMIGYLGEARREKFNLKSNKELYDPLTNAKIAHYMSRGGEDWSSWDIDSSGYNGGVSKSKYQYWLTQYPKG